MKKYNVKQFVRGWFVGDFYPTIIKTQDVEVAIQSFSAGTIEPMHCHKIAREITVIITGKAQMNDEELGPGDMMEIFPGEFVEFKAIADTTTVVVKYPGVKNDKYLLENEK